MSTTDQTTKPRRRRRKPRGTTIPKTASQAERTAALMPARPGPHSQRPAGANGKRLAYESSKDSGMFVSDVLEAQGQREMLVRTRSLAVALVMEHGASEPYLVVGNGTVPEQRAFAEHMRSNWRFQELISLYHELIDPDTDAEAVRV